MKICVEWERSVAQITCLISCDRERLFTANEIVIKPLGSPARQVSIFRRHLSALKLAQRMQPKGGCSDFVSWAEGRKTTASPQDGPSGMSVLNGGRREERPKRSSQMMANCVIELQAFLALFLTFTFVFTFTRFGSIQFHISIQRMWRLISRLHWCQVVWGGGAWRWWIQWTKEQTHLRYNIRQPNYSQGMGQNGRLRA